jgi:hypothetical protein
MADLVLTRTHGWTGRDLASWQCNYKRKARGRREPAPLLSFHLRAVLDQLERGVVA